LKTLARLAGVKEHFRHAGRARAFWRSLVEEAIRTVPTPFFIFSIDPVRGALRELDGLKAGVPIRHWLSCKTQPVRPLLHWWRKQGMGIEVVSEFEYLAARAEGFPPTRILLNGPAKHRWLPRHATRDLSVNFDSTAEAEALLPLAKRLGWRVGVRCLTDAEFDPDEPGRPTQFGMDPREAVHWLKALTRAGALTEMIHFHLRSNLASAAIYDRAICQVADICEGARFLPLYLDVGGGVPPPNTRSRAGQRYDAGFSVKELEGVYRRALRRMPSVEEIWLENGRFISARSGALVLRVVDAKQRRGVRQLVCDGGRTLNALVSTWEEHELLTLGEGTGSTRLTTVCGPTCMAFDQLGRRRLPRSVRVGDVLIWLDAGAYHVPWETRFSHGYAGVVWHDGRRLRLVRQRESFKSWWGQWK
jgi:diaminopimelate decarboxylase